MTPGQQKLQEIINKLSNEGRNPTIEELNCLETLAKELDELIIAIETNQENFGPLPDYSAHKEWKE